MHSIIQIACSSRAAHGSCRWKWYDWLQTCALLLICMTSLSPQAVCSGFVRRSGTQLTIDGQPFYFLGCNAYWLIDLAMYADQRPRVDKFMSLAKAIGFKVVRTWGFNHNLPFAVSGKGLGFSEFEFEGLDYIVAQATANDLRLVVALGNIWPHYVGPEVYLKAATGKTGGEQTVLDYYKSTEASTLYKQYINAVTGRVNKFTGVIYSQDPTIMMWDVMNEPRCPGCMREEEQSVHQSWLKQMGDYTKSVAPNQLVSAGTEGFFMREEFVPYNPGAGSACEGEDWVGVTSMSSYDVGVGHIYWRQTEGFASNGWSRFSYEYYVQWFFQYLRKHKDLAAGMGKPFILEEYNILYGKFSEEQRNAFLKMTFDELLANKYSGGALAGAMIWQAAISGVRDTGYNIYLDSWKLANTATPKSIVSATKGGEAKQVYNASTTPDSNAPSVIKYQDNSSSGGTGRRRLQSGIQSMFHSIEQPYNTSFKHGEQFEIRQSKDPLSAPGRQVLQYEYNQDYLDYFRRRDPRNECAQKAAATWQPISAPDTVDIKTYKNAVAGRDTLDIISEAARQVHS